MIKESIRVRDIFFIVLGTCLYAFGLVTFNIANNLAEGGVTGITLILHALIGLDPAYTTLLINIPLILFGGKVLGSRSFIYTIIGTASLSIFLWIWQRVPITIGIDHDLLIASLLAGLFSGLGSGFVYRVGGTTGGSDIVARILEKKMGISMGRSLLYFDICVLLLSLCYLDVKHMMYTLIASFVFSKIIDFVQDGAYTAKGILIVTNESEQIAANILSTFERGVTFLHGEGAYSKENKKIIYCVVSPQEIIQMKLLVEAVDPKAFISVINVHEAIGEGFTYDKPRRRFYLSRKSS